MTQKEQSLIKPHFVNLSSSGNLLNGMIVERNIEKPKEEYRDLSIEPNKHILVLHNNRINELEWRIDGKREKKQFQKSDLIINPAGLNVKPHWSSDVELLVLAISPEFVKFVAEEMNFSDSITIPVAIFLCMLWILHIRPHQNRPAYSILFLVAAAAILVATFSPWAILLTGSIITTMVVIGVMLSHKKRRATAKIE